MQLNEPRYECTQYGNRCLHVAFLSLEIKLRTSICFSDVQVLLLDKKRCLFMSNEKRRKCILRIKIAKLVFVSRQRKSFFLLLLMHMTTVVVNSNQFSFIH